MDNTQLALSITSVCLNGVQIVFIVIATIFTLRQLRENTKVRQAAVLDKIFEYVSSPEIRNFRKKARDLDLPDNLDQLTTDQKEAIETTLVGWARVGVLLRFKLFGSSEEDRLFETYSLSVDNSWEKLKRYAIYQRAQSGMPDYWFDVEYLAQRARAWRIAHGLPIWKE
ncbi:MAG: DUF4760 domain-containing protein [Syntrophales bacterium]